MQRDQIERLLRELGQYLHARGLVGEILILVGAYMTLVLQQREATRDVDAYFASHAAAALDVVAHYVPAHLLTARVQYVIEDLFDAQAGDLGQRS
jgi:hypothetical protein